MTVAGAHLLLSIPSMTHVIQDDEARKLDKHPNAILCNHCSDLD